MILVFLGTQELEFRRLVEKVDELIHNEVIQDEVFVQLGHTSYSSKRFRYENFLSDEETEKLYLKADLILSHGGVGSLLRGVMKGKRIIACPRVKELGEHVDNHQLEICEHFEEQGYTLSWYHGKNDLEDVIAKAYGFNPKPYKSLRRNLIDDIRKFIS